MEETLKDPKIQQLLVELRNSNNPKYMQEYINIDVRIMQRGTPEMKQKIELLLQSGLLSVQ
jgi:hypothetical protein